MTRVTLSLKEKDTLPLLQAFRYILCHERDLNRTLIADLDFKSSVLPRVTKCFRSMRTLNNKAQYSWCLSHEIVLAL